MPRIPPALARALAHPPRPSCMPQSYIPCISRGAIFGRPNPVTQVRSTPTPTILRQAVPSLLGAARPTFANPSLSILTITSPSAMQARHKSRGTEYQPSQRIRKRRHGFLARLKSRTGRKILERRRLKGRKYLTH